MDSTTEDDARATELETLEAIFPELRRLPDDEHGLKFELDLPVEPASAVTVTFPPAGNAVANADGVNGSCLIESKTGEDSLQVSHLPSLCLRFTLPAGYPEECAPQIDITTTPQWLSSDTLRRLEDDGPKLWEEMGRDMVAYTYIDHIQRGAEDVFGLVNDDGTMNVDPQHKLAVLDYDIKAKKAAFENGTFDCGICLDPKKGTVCHKMMSCDHIFCLQCLQDFYNDAITEGNLSTVRCLAPNCAKEQAAAAKAAGASNKKSKNAFVSPSELLKIGLSEDTVKRYVTLKYKTELEADKNTIYCPRQWCNGAARSKSHKKPQGLEFAEFSDNGDEQDDEQDDDAEDDGQSQSDSSDPKGKGLAKAAKFDPADLLAVCEDCGLAFCSRCLQSWHGEYVRCMAKKDREKLTAEEEASLQYLKLHTSPCPTCSAPAQKTHGCNHMICSRCETHFCYLCSAWLDPTNPYKHYNLQGNGKVTSCYMRLWELEGGDGDDVGLGFAGGAAAVPVVNRAPPPPPQRNRQEEEMELLLLQQHEEEQAQRAAEARQQEEPNANEPPAPRGPAVAREAPLVLRVIGEPARPPPPPAPPAEMPRGGRGRGRGRGGRGTAATGPGRGGRAGRGGGRGHGGQAAAPQQQQRQAPAARNRPGNDNPQRAVPAVVARPAPEGAGANNANVANNGGALNEDQQAWVRRFVAMAIDDMEDELDGDSDDDEMNWMIQ